MGKQLHCIALGVLASISAGVHAETVSVPFTFSAGQTARAADVNANFGAVTSGINALDTRVTSLEDGGAALPSVTTTPASVALGTNVTVLGTAYTVRRYSIPKFSNDSAVWITVPRKSNSIGVGDELVSNMEYVHRFMSPENTALGGFRTTISGFEFVCAEDFYVFSSGQGGMYTQNLRCSTQLDSQSVAIVNFFYSPDSGFDTCASEDDCTNIDPASYKPNASQRANIRSQLRSLLAYVSLSTGH